VQGRNVSFCTADTLGHFLRLCYLERAFSQGEWFERLELIVLFSPPIPLDQKISKTIHGPILVSILYRSSFLPFHRHSNLSPIFLHAGKDLKRPISSKIPRSSNKLRSKRFGLPLRDQIMVLKAEVQGHVSGYSENAHLTTIMIMCKLGKGSQKGTLDLPDQPTPVFPGVVSSNGARLKQTRRLEGS